MANKGVYPVDPLTDVGQVRFAVGDTESQPLDPPEPGFQDYEMFSDDQIEAFLSRSEGSINRSTGYAYLTLASQAAMHSRSVKDHDLAIDYTKRAADLRASAQMWFGLADDEDASAGGADIFEVFTVTEPAIPHPELTPWPYPYRRR